MYAKTNSQKESVKYGSIISFQNDFTSRIETPTLSYYPDPDNLEYFREKKENIIDFLTTRFFLYTHGIFNEFCYLYNFKDKNDIKYNYFNTLFMILPSCEYDAMAKFKNLIKELKNEILMDENPTVNNFQISDSFQKFKQEIEANIKKSAKSMNIESNKVNFNDCVQFLHIKTGKFLCYKTYDQYLKTYVELTEHMSKNTIFRFRPAYVYQVENSTNVFFDLTIQIACGEKKTGNEKFISNIKHHKQNVVLEFGKRLLRWRLNNKLNVATSNERTENLKTVINNIFDSNENPKVNNNKNNLKENLLTLSTNSNLAYQNFGKKLLPKDKYIGVNIKSNDYWKLVSFSENFLIDNKYINSLDYFCIQNIEKNIFISIDKGKEKVDENIQFINFYEERKEERKKDKKEEKKKEKKEERKEERKEDLINTIKNELKKNKNLNQTKKGEEIIQKKNSKATEEEKIIEENEEDVEEKQIVQEEITPEPRNLFNDEYYAKLNYKLQANIYEEKEHYFLEPYSLFKFEIIKNDKENNSEFIHIEKLSTNCYVRLISVFFNKAIAVKGECELKLIDNVDKDDPNYNSTLFKVEKVIERKKKEIIEKSSKNDDNINEREKSDEEENKEKEEKFESYWDNEFIEKDSSIKLKSKGGEFYIGIRVNNRKEKESAKILLTRSISDLTKFKLNYLDEEDKYELHFFEQLLWSLKNLLSFFKQEKKIKIISEENYEKIGHILITFEKKIKTFKNNRSLKIGKEKKFDFLKIIEYFDIVEILIKLFIANWFNDYENVDYEKFEEEILRYFKKENNDLKYKQIISRKILKLLTLIFDLDKSFLNCISSKLLYFFIFVGRDDKCTKFLVHILKNNRVLLISLCPTNLNKEGKNYEENIEFSNDSNSIQLNNLDSLEKYENIKKCLKRIICDYNHYDIDRLTIYFSSVFLFFKLMNCLIIYNSKPFKPFYDYYFQDLDLLKDEGENFVKPNYINNPILIDFFIKNDTIYARKEKFFQKLIGETIDENYKENDEEENESNKISSFSKNITTTSQNNTSNIKEQIQFKLIDLIYFNYNMNSDKHYRQILFAKLVSLNIFFYSNLSLCEPKFKDYLKSVFNTKNIISKYLIVKPSMPSKEQNKKNKAINLNNDLKCSLVQLINYLHFRIPFPFWEKINLFKNLKSSSLGRNKTILDNSNQFENNNTEENDLYDIISYINEIIEDNINTKGQGTDPFLLYQIFECSKYTLRYLYTFKNKEERINLAFNLMSKILRLLDKYIGISKDEKIKGNLSESLNSILNEQLLIKDSVFLVNDKFQFLFQKLKKKLEGILRNKEVKNMKELFKDLFGKAIAKEDKSSFSNSNIRNLKRKSMNKLKKYNLSHILLEISINSNKEQKTIVNEIMYIISTIFYEFLQYIESLDIEELGNNLGELKKAYKGNSNSFELYIIEEIVKTNNENYKDENKLNNNSLARRYIEFKESNENKYIKKFKKQWNISDNISNFFFKFLQVIDNNTELIDLIMKIIYKLNNQKKIYYRNVCNYVLFQKNEDFEKFFKIKELFVNIFETLENINLLKRLDRTSFGLFDHLNFYFESLIKKIFEEEKWRHNNNILYSYEEIKLEENDINNNSSSDFLIESFKFEENPNETNKNIKSDIIKKSEKNINKKLGPFLEVDDEENSTANLLIVQQTLYNLGFMTIINDFFKYIQWIIEENTNKLQHNLNSIEQILISIYKLMVLFIYKNSKHKKIINDKLFLYIYPLKFKNKTVNLLYFIGYFLLNLLFNYETMNHSSQMKNIEKKISMLSELNDLKWENYKTIIPFFVESFKTIIIFGGAKYAAPLFQIINKILDVLIDEKDNEERTNNDLISIVNILEFIIIEQDKRTKEENRNPIINLDKLVSLFLNIIKKLNPESINLSNLKYSKVLVLVTNLIYKNMHLYNNEFLSNKKLNPNLAKCLSNFCDNLNLKDSLIYKDNNSDLKYFNEFIGISIPKMYVILSQSDKKNTLKIGDKGKHILNVIKKFYQIILDYIMKKKKNPNTQVDVKLFMSKNNKDEIKDLIKNISNVEFKYMKIVFDKIEKNGLFYIEENNTSENNEKKNDLLITILNDKEEKKIEFGEMWSKIQLKIIFCQGFEKFQRIVKEEISNERKNFIKSLLKYCESEKSDKEVIIDKNLVEYNKNLKPNITFFTTYSKYFVRYYGNDLINNKNEIYFYFWTSIFLMEYNEKRNCFDENKAKYNKDYFNKDIIKFTLKQFHNINYASSNYENLLFLKFFNSYLCELGGKAKENCLLQIANSSEAENLFNLIRYILDKLSNEINSEINKASNRTKFQDIFDSNSNIKKDEEKRLYFHSNLFEISLDEYIQALEFLIHFSENNQRMKDYLRYQNNNNSKNHNFIIILSSILESFIQDENHNNKNLIDKYFNIIIKILECITKCCNSSSDENQDCIVKETNLLKFTKYILDNITYRQKKYFFNDFFSENDKVSKEDSEINNNKNLIECLSIGLDRKKLSYLKYQLLFFLSVLTVGREKNDKIYELIHQIIAFDTLVNVIVETYKEILIEKDCQYNPESLNFDENMLARNNNPEYQNLANWDDTIGDENFIIFEIGTYSFLLINIYLENLTRPEDIDIYDEIITIKNKLREEKCKVIEKSIFDASIKFFKCFGKIFKKLFSCSSGKNKNEDFNLPNSFANAYKFFFDYTPEIEILFKGQIIKYYVKLSPICKCLTREMKEEFNKNLDRTSTKTKIECLFNNVEYFEYQLNNGKNRMDAFQKHPTLDLLFNQYNFYMDVFYIISILLNLLLFSSYYRTNDDTGKVEKFSENFKFRYGLLYRKSNIIVTENIIFYLTLVETIFGCLILINYFIIRIPYLTFYKNSIFYDEDENIYDGNDNIPEYIEETDKYYYIKKVISIIINIFSDTKLMFHLLLFIICLFSLFIDPRFITALLIDVIKKSKFLMMITIVVWESKMQLLALIFLFYLIAYYLIIFIYMFIPDQALNYHCFSFRECFFTLCDQTIKNSNGVINYLKEDGLYSADSLWTNVRFYTDNLFAILEYFIVLQIFTAVIIIGFTLKTKENNKIEKDMNNICFICGLKKSELSKYYNKLGFNGHIKLDHYLWNYMFAIFNVTKKDEKNLISLDRLIYENYKKKIFKTWIPFQTCKIKSEEDMKKKRY